MSLVNKFIHPRGFSIVELMVCIAIIGLLSVFTIANFRGQGEKLALARETQRLSGILRQAHISAITGQLVNGARPAGGFGVRLAECGRQDNGSDLGDCQYIVFADQADADGNVDRVYDPILGDDTVLQTQTNIENNVYIESIITVPAAVVTSLDIVFTSEPPYGVIYLNGDIALDSATIQLGFEQRADYKKNLTIDRRTGKIDID